MDEKKKLSVVIEHWVEHNQSHMGEYQRWAQKAGELELELVKAQIEEAIGKLSQCNHCLAKALERL
jgi:hypothetical protein